MSRTPSAYGRTGCRVGLSESLSHVPQALDHRPRLLRGQRLRRLTRRSDPKWTEHHSGVPHFLRADLDEISLVLEGSVPDTALLGFRGVDPSRYGPEGQRLAEALDFTFAEPADAAAIEDALAASERALLKVDAW